MTWLVGLLFIDEEQKRLACDIFNTFATCAILVYHTDFQEHKMTALTVAFVRLFKH